MPPNICTIDRHGEPESFEEAMQDTRKEWRDAMQDE